MSDDFRGAGGQFKDNLHAIVTLFSIPYTVHIPVRFLSSTSKEYFEAELEHD